MRNKLSIQYQFIVLSQIMTVLWYSEYCTVATKLSGAACFMLNTATSVMVKPVHSNIINPCGKHRAAKKYLFLATPNKFSVFHS